jgi:hypothetical protein
MIDRWEVARPSSIAAVGPEKLLGICSHGILDRLHEPSRVLQHVGVSVTGALN